MERRVFVKHMGSLALMSALLPELLACDSKKNIPTTLLGANFKRGHLLRSSQHASRPLTASTRKKIVIVGGGVSGLVALYMLKQQGVQDVLLLELNDEVGGNSGSVETHFSKAPLGAHYLSLPNQDNEPMIGFLVETGLILGQKGEKYIYNDRHLCHAPNERLFYRGQFQEGLVPHYGINKETSDEIERFFNWMKELKQSVNEEEKQLFNIPVDHADYTAHLDGLDQISFEQFLLNHNFRKEELLWFLDYCCRDDFGAGMDKVSAWAGVNYFAGRKAIPENAEPTSVLTWPEGNSFLVDKLKQHTETHIRKDALVTKVVENEEEVVIHYLDCTTNEKFEIIAEHCIMACPSYVNKHILQSPVWKPDFFDKFTHFPWLIGIVTVREMPSHNGVPLAWDNVKYGSKGLGYISNRNQELNRTVGPQVLSVYLTLDQQDAVTERARLFQLTEEEMKDMILKELKSIHADIEQEVLSVVIQRWGHGMVTPVPGTLALHAAYVKKRELVKRVDLAHTDFAGYSVFEEAFQAGYMAAERILRHA